MKQAWTCQNDSNETSRAICQFQVVLSLRVLKANQGLS